MPNHNDARDRAVLSFLAGRPNGSSIHALHGLCGGSFESIRHLTRRLREGGLIACVRHGSAAVWSLPEHAAAMQSATLNSRQRELLKMASAPAGLYALEAKCCGSRSRALSALVVLERRGLLEFRMNGKRKLWAAVGKADAALARRRTLEARQANREGPALSQRPVVARVPAATAPRIVTRGVASVFDLAHAA